MHFKRFKDFIPGSAPFRRVGKRGFPGPVKFCLVGHVAPDVLALSFKLESANIIFGAVAAGPNFSADHSGPMYIETESDGPPRPVSGFMAV